MPTAEYSERHIWIAAATVDLDDRQARRAVLRHSVRIPRELKIDVLEVYCQQCRRPWDDVCDDPCSAFESNEHLRGGPIGERKKRAHHRHNCEALGCVLPPHEETPDVGDGDSDSQAPMSA